jgi:hypothetical protein
VRRRGVEFGHGSTVERAAVVRDQERAAAYRVLIQIL